jgi:hypothetical protein
MNAGFLPSNNKVALIQGLAGVECAAVACTFMDMDGAGNRVRALFVYPELRRGASQIDDGSSCAS